MLKIQEYEFNSEPGNNLETEQKVKIDGSMELGIPDLRDLLYKLSCLLQERDTIVAMWPESEPYADSELFSHMHIEFDSKKEKVKLATAATNVAGTPIHEYEYEIEGELTVTPLPRPPPPPQTLQTTTATVHSANTASSTTQPGSTGNPTTNVYSPTYTNYGQPTTTTPPRVQQDSPKSTIREVWDFLGH